MNKKVKTKWLTALRTGQVNGKPIQQTRHALRNPNESNGTKNLCCLGVLCEIAVSEGVIKRDKRKSQGGDTQFYYGRCSDDTELPLEVMAWAGMDSNQTDQFMSTDDVGKAHLAKLNDYHDFSFDNIANEIEKNL
jgi:hypothetical protein